MIAVITRQRTIPSTETEQHSSDALIDASTLDLSVIGNMNTDGRFLHTVHPY